MPAMRTRTMLSPGAVAGSGQSRRSETPLSITIARMMSDGFGTALKQKNREATTPRFSFDDVSNAQSDLPLDAGFLRWRLSLGAAFSLEAAFCSTSGAFGSEVEALLSVLGFDALARRGATVGAITRTRSISGRRGSFSRSRSRTIRCP